MTKPTISKSQYLKGLQCPKALSSYRSGKDSQETSEAVQDAYDRGNEIGELAKKFFPDAVEISFPHYQITQAAQATERYVVAGKQAIFEATAINPANGCYSRIDILQQVPNFAEWDLIEVKSSSKVADYHYEYEEKMTRFTKQTLKQEAEKDLQNIELLIVKVQDVARRESWKNAETLGTLAKLFEAKSRDLQTIKDCL